MLLHINCCVRKDSRTLRLAKELISSIADPNVVQLDLEKEGLKPLDGATLAKRDRLIGENDFSDPMFRYAKQFMDADTIVVSAPFWDYSFPSMLKVYIEHVFCVGLISVYDQQGVPHGQCKANVLYYVSTSGGPFMPQFGFDWISAVAKNSFGIKETKLVHAEMLDIVGHDADAIMEKAIKEVKKCR